MEDQDKLRQMRSQDVLKQPNTSSFQDGMDQYQKPTDNDVHEAIKECNAALNKSMLEHHDKGSKFHFTTEAINLFLAALRKMKGDPK